MPNPIKDYRRTQRAIRDRFDAFTATHCPDCPDPCCRKPARVDEFDVLLAESLGHSLPPSCPSSDRADAAAQILQIGRLQREDDVPCDYLMPHGCAFPNDLRPLGCTTFVCKFMERDLSSRELQDIKRLGKRLETLRQAIVRSVGLKSGG